MKILKQGIIENGICTCERCFAKLEYSTKDIIGSGKIIPSSNSEDWLDYPVIQYSWPEYVKDILIKYKEKYVATGYFAKREGYIECPCCGNKITFDKFLVQTSVYPGDSVGADGDIDLKKTILIPNTNVRLLISHYKEFYKK